MATAIAYDNRLICVTFDLSWGARQVYNISNNLWQCNIKGEKVTNQSHPAKLKFSDVPEATKLSRLSPFFPPSETL